MTIEEIMNDHPPGITKIRRKTWPKGYWFSPTHKYQLNDGKWYGLTQKSFYGSNSAKMFIFDNNEKDWEIFKAHES